MYMGVKNHHILPRVASYEDACRALEVWESKPRRGKQVVQVVRHSEAIAFRLYETDVVTWEPDNSVDIDNYGTATTSGFARQFLPAGVYLNHPVERRGASGGANTIRFHNGDSWALCQGGVVRFAEQDGAWAPDEDTCYDISLPTGVDRGEARELVRTYHFAEFETWLAMAPMHLGDVEHNEWDLLECMAALTKRDWRQAAEHLPLVKDTGAFGRKLSPLPILTRFYGEKVTMASLAKLKLAIWDWHGLLSTETRKVWGCREFERRMKRVRELDALGVGVHGMGPH